MNTAAILARVPYAEPFLFVDTLEHVDEEGVEGTYTFREDLPFYAGHFKGNPITPGVLLTECCAQIGLVCLGIYLCREQGLHPGLFALSSSEMAYFLPVFPGETVRVRSKKLYFRFGKLKCEVRLYKEGDRLACKGVLAGMLRGKDDA